VSEREKTLVRKKKKKKRKKKKKKEEDSWINMTGQSYSTAQHSTAQYSTVVKYPCK
jgi:hypothetical protein